ncbi:unnamed protein product [Camellia sinensis]
MTHHIQEGIKKMLLPIKERQIVTQDHNQDAIDEMQEGHYQNPSGNHQSLVLHFHFHFHLLIGQPEGKKRSHTIRRFTGWWNAQLFLFEKRVEPEDILRSRLAIPWTIARQHFLSHRQPHKTAIQISDSQNKDWQMTVAINPRNCNYLVQQGWQEFAAAHNLEAMDVVHFYGAKCPWEVYHYVVKCVKAKKTKSDVNQSGKQKHDDYEDNDSKKHGGHGGNQGQAPVQA